MKLILKGLLVVVATLGGCIGLQAMQNITSIETTEPDTELLLVAHDRLDTSTMGNFTFSNDITARYLEILKAKKEDLPMAFSISDKEMLSIINLKKKTVNIFTAPKIQNFDPNNISGNWTLKIEGDEVSFEKP